MTHYCRMAATGDRVQIERYRRERAAAIRAAAEQINSDLAAIPRITEALASVLAEYNQQIMNSDGRRPMAAELLVARELRRTVFIAIGHRYAMALLPRTIDVLAGRDTVSVLTRPELEGARGRRFYSGQATLVATLRASFAPARHQMYEEWTARERRLVFDEVERLSIAVRASARRAHREQFGDAWTDPQALREPYLRRDGDYRPHRSRTLAFLAEHLNRSLDVSLRNSELGQAEHLAVGLTDLRDAFDTAGCAPSERTAVSLAHLHILSSLAALRDEVADRIVFHPEHRPLYRVDAAKDGGWRISAERPPMNGRVLERPGRCPAITTLPPTLPRHSAMVDTFKSLLTELTGEPLPRHLADRGVSAADVSSAFAIGVMDKCSNAPRQLSYGAAAVRVVRDPG